MRFYPQALIDAETGLPIATLRGQSGIVVPVGSSTPLNLRDIDGNVIPNTPAEPITATLLGFTPLFDTVEDVLEAEFLSNGIRTPLRSDLGIREQVYAARDDAAGAEESAAISRLAASNAEQASAIAQAAAQASAVSVASEAAEAQTARDEAVAAAELATAPTEQVVTTILDKPDGPGRVFTQVTEGPYPVSREGVDLTGATDSTVAMQAAFAKLPAGGGGALIIPPGSRVRHDGLTITGRSGFSIIGDGAELRASTSTKPYMRLVECSDFSVSGVASGGVNPTVRQGPTRAFSFEKCTNFQADRISARDTEGVGVYLEFCEDAQLGQVKIRNTKADGMHITRGSKRIHVTDVHTRDTGDDGVAVVSYNNGDDICSDITIVNASSYRSKSRGLACVGGRRVRFIGGSVVQSKGAGIYAAEEASYNTYGITDLLFQGIDVSEANTYDNPTTNYAGAHVAASLKSAIQNVRIFDCVIRASRWHSMLLSGSDITVGRTKMYGGVNGINANSIHNLSLLGNYIQGTSQWGAFLGTLGTGYLKVVDNVLEDLNSSLTAGADAIYTGATSYDGGGIIDGNIVIDALARLEQGIQATSTGLIIGINHLNGRPMTVPATAAAVRMGASLRLDGGFGLGKGGVGRQTLPAAATDAASTQSLANSLRTAMVNFGLGQ